MDIEGLKSYIGKTVGSRKIDYTWRDLVIYALGVGAKADELEYTYEKDMKTLPTYLSSVYWNGQFGVTPQSTGPYCPYSDLIAFSENDLGKWPGGTHMDHELEIIRPIDPIKGTLLLKDKVKNIFDRGEGKGVAVRTEVVGYDEAGRLVAVNRGTHLLSAYGGFGGEPLPKSTVTIPEDRKPDYVFEDSISETQNLLYRLTSDTLPAHVDREYAKSRGFKAPIMQGLCSLGYAARWGIKACAPGHPERMKKISAQMRSFCYPGDSLVFMGWKKENGIVFRLVNAQSGDKILDRGFIDFIEEA